MAEVKVDLAPFAWRTVSLLLRFGARVLPP